KPERNPDVIYIPGFMSSPESVRAFIAPRGIGLSAWSGDDKKQVQIRRRFMLLGQTLDGMRGWDIRRAVQTVHFLGEGDRGKIIEVPCLSGNARYAALFEPGFGKLPRQSLMTTETVTADYLNIFRYSDVKAVLELVQGEGR